MPSSSAAPNSITLLSDGGPEPMWSLKSCPWWLQWRMDKNVLWLTVEHCGFHSGKVQIHSNAGNVEISVSSAVLPSPWRALTGLGRGLAAVGVVLAVAGLLMGIATALGIISFFGAPYSGPLLPIIFSGIMFALLVLGPIALLLTLLWGAVMGNGSLMGRSLLGLVVASIFTLPAFAFMPEAFANVSWSDSTRLFGILTTASSIGICVFVLFTGGPRTMLITIPLVLVLSAIAFFAMESIWLQIFEPPSANFQKLYNEARKQGRGAETFVFLISMPSILIFWIKILFGALLYIQLIFTLALPFLAMFLVPVKSTSAAIDAPFRPLAAFAGSVMVMVPALAALGFIGWRVRQSLPPPEEMAWRKELPVSTINTNLSKARPATNTITKPWSASDSSFHLEEAWTRELNQRNAKGPVIGQNRSLYMAVGKTLIALSEDGSEQWRFETDSDIRFSPRVLSDGSISIYSTFNRVTVLAPEGTEKWSRKLPFISARNTLTTSEGSLYVSVKTSTNRTHSRSSTNEYSFIALRPDNSTNWLVQLTGELVGPSQSPDGRVLYIGDTKTLRALDEYGTERWRFDPETPFSKFRVGGDGTIFVVARTRLLAISPDGTKQWEFQPPVRFPITYLILHSNSLVLCRAGSTLHAVGPGGQLLWKKTFEATLMESTQSENIYGTDSQWLYILSPDGAQERKVRAEAGANMLQVVGHRNRVYILSSFGSNLHALRVP